MRVVLEHVSKTFARGVRAVQDLCLEVADGELVVLVGPSGCGKTTTLRLIAGLERASAGTIKIGPHVVNDRPPKDRNVAMVFQRPALYPHLTVAQNLAFALRLRGRPRAEIETKVRRAAEVLGISHLLPRRPGQLSGGEQQRVALGRAIVREPDCFLFDEPLSSLDPLLRAEMRSELRRLHRRLSTATLYVTHDQEEAMTLGTRVVVMRAGRIQQSGPPLDVYHHPVNRFVAGFFGSPPMNFLEGTILRAGGRLWFDHAAQRLPVPERIAARLTKKAGARAVLGVRPEHLRPTAFKGQPEAVLRATVVDVELLGDRTHLRLVTACDQAIVARWERETALVPGATVELHVDLSRAHFFDADEAGSNHSGRNLGLEPNTSLPA